MLQITETSLLRGITAIRGGRETAGIKPSYKITMLFAAFVLMRFAAPVKN